MVIKIKKNKQPRYCLDCNRIISKRSQGRCIYCNAIALSRNNIITGKLLSYATIHAWMSRHKPKINVCENCNLEKKLELTYKDHSVGTKKIIRYGRNFEDWTWLCRSCHMKLDGRLEIIRVSAQNHWKNKRSLKNATY
jgi:hypothetical protein